MICTTCGNEKDYVIQLPIIVMSKEGKAYTREGYRSDGNSATICFECLQFEVEETL